MLSAGPAGSAGGPGRAEDRARPSRAPDEDAPVDAPAVLLAGARARAARAELLALRRDALVAERAPLREVPPARRWALSLRAGAAGSLVLLALAGAVATSTASRGPQVLVSTGEAARVTGTSAEGDAGSTTAAPTQELVVHVVGAVQVPGVVVLAQGARAADALAAAGGALAEADLARVNLARPVQDGEQLVVPRLGEQEPAGVVDGTAAEQPGVLDLNSADAAALEALPRIGPVLAERIVEWRREHGRFSSVDELAEVPGIGPALLAGLDGLVRV